MTTLPSPAPNLVRERLAPPALVIGLALGIILTLALLFNPQAVLRRITDSHTPSIDLYFVKVAAYGSHKISWQLLLAKQDVETGHYQAALQTLKPLLVASLASSYRDRARWLYFSDLLAVTYSYPQGDLQRTRNEHALRLLIPQLRTNAKGAALNRLAHEAVVLHEEHAAIAIYKDLAAQSSRRRALFYALAGAAALGLGHAREAARLYFAAQTSATTIQEKRQNFLTGLRILQGDNQVVFALREAERHIGNLGRDPLVLRYIIALARAADKPRIAAYYAQMLVVMR
ncbi:MAG: hypothetical protein ACYDEV_13400 [Acidiferrobacter sp.]